VTLLPTLLWLTCLAGLASGQIGIPPGVLPNKPRPVKKPRKPSTAPAPRDKTEKKPSLGKLLGDFRRAAGKSAEREKIAAQILESGPRGTKVLGGIVTRGLSRRTAVYRKAFYDKARRVGVAKQRSVDRKLAQKHQEQFQSLHKDKKLITKDTLKSKAGPALHYLRDAMIVNRDEVLKDDKSLAARREEILALDRIAGKCRQSLDTKAKTGDDKPATLSETLKQQETLIALMCTALTRDGRKAIESDFKHLAELSFEDSHGLLYLNIIRLLLGLRPMRTDLKLCEAALGHSIDMYNHKFFSHESPVKGKKTPWDRAKLAGTNSNGECIAGGRTGPGVIDMWFFSSGHHTIMMSGVPRVGLGGYKGKWTLMTGP